MEELEEVRAKVQPEKIRAFISQKNPGSCCTNWVKTKGCEASMKITFEKSLRPTSCFRIFWLKLLYFSVLRPFINGLSEPLFHSSIFIANKCEKLSMYYLVPWDSKSWHLGHENLPINTRPGGGPIKILQHKFYAMKILKAFWLVEKFE